MGSVNLSECLIRAISDPACWNVALKEVCDFTKASKALISLRDKKSARIVIPENVSVEFASPLIYGFDEVHVASFLEDYADNDPWTDIERDNYPYFPYALSRYLPRDRLRQSPFWNWLEPQNINECVVAELGQGDAYWAALNLYFDAPDAEKSEAVVHRLKEILPILQSTWQSGRNFQIAQTDKVSLDMVLAAMDMPAALITQDGRIEACNTALSDLADDWSTRLEVGRALSLPANIPLGLGDDVPSIRLSRAAPSSASGIRKHAVVSSFRSAALSGGETREIFLLTVSTAKREIAESGQLIWDAQILTDRERTLVRLVAQGHKFREAQIEMGVSYPRIMQLWKSARGKLELDDVTDLRLSYRLSQN